MTRKIEETWKLNDSAIRQTIFYPKEVGNVVVIPGLIAAVLVIVVLHYKSLPEVHYCVTFLWQT